MSNPELPSSEIAGLSKRIEIKPRGRLEPRDTYCAVTGFTGNGGPPGRLELSVIDAERIEEAHFGAGDGKIDMPIEVVWVAIADTLDQPLPFEGNVAEFEIAVPPRRNKVVTHGEADHLLRVTAIRDDRGDRVVSIRPA